MRIERLDDPRSDDPLAGTLAVATLDPHDDRSGRGDLASRVDVLRERRDRRDLAGREHDAQLDVTTRRAAFLVLARDPHRREQLLGDADLPLAVLAGERRVADAELARLGHAGVAEDQVIMKSIALGWPDETFPANAVVSERKSVAEATVFVGFDD